MAIVLRYITPWCACEVAIDDSSIRNSKVVVSLGVQLQCPVRDCGAMYHGNKPLAGNSEAETTKHKATSQVAVYWRVF